jgi:hypothetical protein
MKTIISRLTMKRKKHLFYDKVDFNPVCLYEDKYGQKWMANDPFRFWSFRVKHELNKSE